MASIDQFRFAIDEGVASGELQSVDVPLFHYHTDNLYGRRVILPAGSVLTSKVHKFDHITMILSGHATIIDEQGIKTEVRAPDMFVTKAGTQRVLLIHEDFDIATVHHCVEHDDDAMINLLGCDTMQEYNEMKLLEGAV